MSEPRRRRGVPDEAALANARRVVAERLDTTPCRLVELDGLALWLKLENQQPTGSFKVRGALAALSIDSEPVVACSAGNHGLGVAFAAKQLGIHASIVIPETASAAKVEKLGHFDVELLRQGNDYDEAEAFALALAEERDWRFVSPYNDPDVIAGQATLVTELLAQQGDLDEVIVSVGGGGLLAGSLLAVQGSAVSVRGAQVTTNAAFEHLLGGGRLRDVLLEPTIADGVAGGLEEDSVTLDLVRELGTSLDHIDEAEIRSTMKELFDQLGMKVEGSAALAVAAAQKRARTGAKVCAVVSGGNIADAVFASILDGL